MSFGGVFHDFLQGTWDEAKGYLREELEQLRLSLNNQVSSKFTEDGFISANAFEGNSKPATRYLSNTGTNNAPKWDQVNLSNGVKSILEFIFLPKIAASTLLGRRSTGTSGVIESITLGPGLQMTGTVLSTTGSGSSVRVATTANITIATALNPADSLDGIALSNGDRVLVKNQSAPAENGVYVVGAAPARADDFSTYANHPAALIVVQEGTTNADTLWLCTSNAGGTLGVTAITFIQVSTNGVTTTGSPTTGSITMFSGATTITNVDAAGVSAALDLLGT